MMVMVMVMMMVMMSSLSFSPNFYILDEPTNHLDMETIEALAKALNKFKVSVRPVSEGGSVSGVSAHLCDVTCFRVESSWCRTTSA